ncbi:MAG: cation diffusion facilitator family transporter [Bryobacteraceae bacterium]
MIQPTVKTIGDRHGSHKHGHAHEHDGGLIGWLHGMYGHSHSVAEKIDSVMESSERGIRALKISLVGLGLTAALQLVVVLLSGSVALLADTIHNFADAGTSLPLWVAFALARRGPSRRFTYGYGRCEDIAGVLIVLIILFSAGVAAYESVRKMIEPEPVSRLGWVALAALIGFLGNEAVAVFRIRVGRRIGSAALVADGEHARVDGFTSLAVLIGVLGVWLGFPMLDPIVGILITVAILFIVKNAAISIWTRLLDGIEPEILAEIEHAPIHVEGVVGIWDVRARWLGHHLYSEMSIDVDPALSVGAAAAIARNVEDVLRQHVRSLGEVAVRIRPGGSPFAVLTSASVQSANSRRARALE